MTTSTIRLRDVRAHNLDGVDVEVPRGKLTVVTGVSGSGKSSLVFDTLHAASERRYLETLSSHARQFLQRMPSPDMGSAAGLSPSIALSQRRAGDHARSTVGTLSGLHDLLRFWFARENGMEPRHLSFVSAGGCGVCRGLGAVDEVSKELLVADPRRTLREGALVPTTPTGYIVYSQVTVDALNTVCNAHGFDVDTPWEQLTSAQQDVVFFGSDRVEVPFGKHSLESRMKWEGITAKPRELGHYKGIIPTIADILRRTRNENALRFARSVACAACGGTRLSEEARMASVGGLRFDAALRLPFPELASWCRGFDGDESARLQRRLDAFGQLGLAHLSCERSTASLSGGEHQRLRLGAIATDGLAGVTFVFDEPSIGLHATEEAAVLDLLLDLRDAGNTVVVVEHSEHALRAADHVVDVGPGAGRAGGQILYAGPPSGLCDAAAESATRALYKPDSAPRSTRGPRGTADADWVAVEGACANNLKSVDARFALGRLNVVAGVAGAGKSSLVGEVLARAARGDSLAGRASAVRGLDEIRRVVHVDQEPIGRTPRSNPATYTGVFDEIRKLFAAEPLARERGYKATTFSFNTKAGGRCPTCEGSGCEVVGMHGLPPVELVCASCGGRRFREEVLDVRVDGASVLDVLEMTVDAAAAHFRAAPKIHAVLAALASVGLGHLTLGQPATTLSGGEAQRVKLAGELARGGVGGSALFLLEEPTIGLHRQDVAQLLRALDGLVERGHTVVLVEHDLDVLRAADHVVDLGPGAGPAGGRVVGEGAAVDLAKADSPTGRALRGETTARARAAATERPEIQLRGVSTHNLKGIDLELPASGLTVVTGASGSGKSSLVFDTLFGESRARMTEHLSGFVQRQLGAGEVRGRTLREARGLRPAIALRQRAEADSAADRRATVATAAALHPLLRTMWSRAASEGLPAAAFSFFRKEGACEECGGLGVVRRCVASAVVEDVGAPLFDG
ncbi:MAG: excinuclease ABC subunit UvrA, partial [Planctomycetota bacterium]|nr:excinuclease ABC subunit UvrA [Planctomycetota bacterium]